MVSWKKRYNELYKQYNDPTNTGMACPRCEHEGRNSLLVWYPYGELVCINKNCDFDKTINDILSVFYYQQNIGQLEQ